MSSELAGFLGKMAAAAASDGGRKADLLRFETEEECLEHCKKLAGLKPGDSVYTKAKDSPLCRGVYMGNCDDGGRARVLFYDQDKEITAGAYPWGCIRFDAPEYLG